MIQVAYREAESLKRQEALIREEEEAERLEEYRLQIKAQAERERRLKKKVGETRCDCGLDFVMLAMLDFLCPSILSVWRGICSSFAHIAL